MVYCFNCKKNYTYQHHCIQNVKDFMKYEEYFKLIELRKKYLKYNNYDYKLYSSGKVDLVKYNDDIKKELIEYLYHPYRIAEFLENNEDIEMYLN